MMPRFPPKSSTGPTPCDGCWKVNRCKAENLRCEAYCLFARQASAARWRLAPRAATHALFLTLEELLARPKPAPVNS